MSNEATEIKENTEEGGLVEPLVIFSHSDVETLAESVLEHWEESDPQNSYHCRFCWGKFDRTKDRGAPGYKYPHDTDCPVHVANDVMTRI